MTTTLLEPLAIPEVSDEMLSTLRLQDLLRLRQTSRAGRTAADGSLRRMYFQIYHELSSDMPIGLVIRKLKDVHITAKNQDDPEFQEKYDPDRINIVTIPYGNYIEAGAFVGCIGLTQVHFPQSMDYIQEEAFAGCTGLTQIHFPESLTTIDDGAFMGCTGLTQVHFPQSIDYIGDSAFKGCTALTKVRLPKSTTIENLAFDDSVQIVQ